MLPIYKYLKRFQNNVRREKIIKNSCARLRKAHKNHSRLRKWRKALKRTINSCFV